MSPCPNHSALGGGVLWAGGSGDLRFPQRSRAALLSGMMTSLCSRCLVYMNALSKRSGHGKKGQIRKTVGMLPELDGEFVLVLLQMEEKRRVGF